MVQSSITPDRSQPRKQAPQGLRVSRDYRGGGRLSDCREMTTQFLHDAVERFVGYGLVLVASSRQHDRCSTCAQIADELSDQGTFANAGYYNAAFGM